MAINLIQQPASGTPITNTDYTNQNLLINGAITGRSQILTDFNNTTTVPDIKQGTYLYHAGNLYSVDSSDYTILGTPAQGWNYIKLFPSGTTLTATWEQAYSGTYTYNPAYQGWYDGTSFAQILFASTLYLDGISYYRAVNSENMPYHWFLGDGSTRHRVGNSVSPTGNVETDGGNIDTDGGDITTGGGDVDAEGGNVTGKNVYTETVESVSTHLELKTENDTSNGTRYVLDADTETRTKDTITIATYRIQAGDTQGNTYTALKRDFFPGVGSAPFAYKPVIGTLLTASGGSSGFNELEYTTAGATDVIILRNVTGFSDQYYYDGLSTIVTGPISLFGIIS